VIRGGVYRERVLVKSSGTVQVPIRFEAAPGEHVVVTGADRLTGWQKADDTRPIYRVACRTNSSPGIQPWPILPTNTTASSAVVSR